MKRLTKISQLPWRPSGLILDPYAGSRCWWKGLDTSRVVFVDRYFVTPGAIQADAAQLPFADGTFDEVWADPPHWIRRSPFRHKVGATATAWSRHVPNREHGYYGTYPTRKHVIDEWTAVARELHRVTKPAAHLVWKSLTRPRPSASASAAPNWPA